MSKPTAAAIKRFEERFSKLFGEGTIGRASDIAPYEVISTGSLTLDYMLSVGGYVEGRLVEIWGPEGTGKTRLSLLAMAEAQRKHPDKLVAFIDMEQKIDRAWMELHGVDTSKVHLIEPQSAEDVADAMKEIVSSGFHSMVVLDSIGSMISEAEKEKAAAEATVGKVPGIVTRMVKIAAVEAQKTGTVVIFINQVRANLSYGADIQTPGGWALKHATTMKLRLKRTSTPPMKVKIAGEDRTVGHEVAIVIERNGVANAYRTAIVSMLHVPTDKFGPVGIDRADEAVTLGLRAGVITQSGAWYSIFEEGHPHYERLQGREAVVNTLRSKPETLEKVRQRVLSSVVGEVTDEVAPEDIPDGPDFLRGQG